MKELIIICVSIICFSLSYDRGYTCIAETIFYSKQIAYYKRAGVDTYNMYHARYIALRKGIVAAAILVAAVTVILSYGVLAILTAPIC